MLAIAEVPGVDHVIKKSNFEKIRHFIHTVVPMDLKKMSANSVKTLDSYC